MNSSSADKFILIIWAHLHPESSHWAQSCEVLNSCSTALAEGHAAVFQYDSLNKAHENSDKSLAVSLQKAVERVENKNILKQKTYLQAEGAKHAN